MCVCIYYHIKQFCLIDWFGFFSWIVYLFIIFHVLFIIVYTSYILIAYFISWHFEQSHPIGLIQPGGRRTGSVEEGKWWGGYLRAQARSQQAGSGSVHSQCLSLESTVEREQSVQHHSCVTTIYANGPLHMLIQHIYIKVNRLLHCFLTSASIHDYLFWFLCKTSYKHGAGILSTCQWVCFQWQPKALIILL